MNKNRRYELGVSKRNIELAIDVANRVLQMEYKSIDIFQNKDLQKVIVLENGCKNIKEAIEKMEEAFDILSKVQE